jgi:hypothetical protein
MGYKFSTGRHSRPCEKSNREEIILNIGFTYYKLGPSVDGKKLIEGKDMPSWESLAKYVYNLATGKGIDEVSLVKSTWQIKGTDVYLIYKDSIEELKNLAITRDWLESVKEKKGKKIVYAPACFLDKETLDEYDISFVQIPFKLVYTYYSVWSSRTHKKKLVKAIDSFFQNWRSEFLAYTDTSLLIG